MKLTDDEILDVVKYAEEADEYYKRKYLDDENNRKEEVSKEYNIGKDDN